MEANCKPGYKNSVLFLCADTNAFEFCEQLLLLSLQIFLVNLYKLQIPRLKDALAQNLTNNCYDVCINVYQYDTKLTRYLYTKF